jgi:hypothetical protein
LDELLHLYRRVTSKALMISRTLGIEGRTLLTPDDDFDPIKELNEQCDGALSDAEQLRLEYVRLVAQHPELAATLGRLPLKVYSGRVSPRPGARAVFFCYRIPRPDSSLVETESGEPRWSDAAGFTVWLCYDLEGERALAEPGPIAHLIRSAPDTPRHCALDREVLARLRKQAEKDLTNEHLKPLQAPPGVAPMLKCWMELS